MKDLETEGVYPLTNPIDTRPLHQSSGSSSSPSPRLRLPLAKAAARARVATHSCGVPLVVGR
jgi:hypothetical protein